MAKPPEPAEPKIEWTPEVFYRSVKGWLKDELEHARLGSMDIRARGTQLGLDKETNDLLFQDVYRQAIINYQKFAAMLDDVMAATRRNNLALLAAPAKEPKPKRKRRKKCA